ALPSTTPTRPTATVTASATRATGAPPATATASATPSTTARTPPTPARPTATATATAAPATTAPPAPRRPTPPATATAAPAQPNPGQEDRDGDGIADACGPQVSIAGMVAGDSGFTADVRLASPSGRSLAGMVEVLDGQGVSALTYTWLATSCASPQDTLDLTINGVTVMRVLPEPDGLHCSCTPASHVVEVPLANALGLLGPGVNQLGMRKSTGLPGQARSALAWAYATITIGGVEQRVDIFDELGGN